MQIYKIKNTRLKLESRISHLHKIFYSAIYLGANKLSNIDVIINNSLRSLLISTNMINNVQVYANSIYWLTVDHFSLESPHSKLSIHYVSKISEKRIDSKISESNAIEFIKDDAVKSDKSYRQRVDVSF